MKKLKPLKAIRKFCLWCSGEFSPEVRQCLSDDCGFYPFRFNKGRPKLRVIRKKCIDCSAGFLPDVKNCWDIECSLYPYRMGKNPSLKGKRGNPAWQKAIGERKPLITNGLVGGTARMVEE